MRLRRWEPVREIIWIWEAMKRFFQNEYARPGRPRVAFLGEGNLSLEAYHTPENLVIQAAFPGAKPEEVDVTVTGSTLTIRRADGSEEEVKESSYLVKERRHGTLSRTVTLPRGPEDGRV